MVNVTVPVEIARNPTCAEVRAIQVTDVLRATTSASEYKFDPVDFRPTLVDSSGQLQGGNGNFGASAHTMRLSGAASGSFMIIISYKRIAELAGKPYSTFDNQNYAAADLVDCSCTYRAGHHR